jgi:hypothetical protein
MKKSMVTLEILVGLLTLIATAITLYPFKFFGIRTGGMILFFGIIISAVTLLVVGIFRLASVFSYGSLSLAIKINVVTSVLTMAVAVVILYFQIVVIGTSWLNLLFGFGLLSYAIGRVVIGALKNEFHFGLRAFNFAIGIAIGILSIIVIFFPLVLISSGANSQVYLPYGYFARIALILIGVDCLVSAILGMFLRKQTQTIDAKNVALA